MRIRNAAVWTDEHFVILITEVHKGKMTMSEKGGFFSVYLWSLEWKFSIYLYMMYTFCFFIEVQISSFWLRHFRNMMFFWVQYCL